MSRQNDAAALNTPQKRQDYTCSLQQHSSEPHTKEFMVEIVVYHHF
jgi:hypothetical protein